MLRHVLIKWMSGLLCVGRTVQSCPRDGPRFEMIAIKLTEKGWKNPDELVAKTRLRPDLVSLQRRCLH